MLPNLDRAIFRASYSVPQDTPILSSVVSGRVAGHSVRISNLEDAGQVVNVPSRPGIGAQEGDPAA